MAAKKKGKAMPPGMAMAQMQKSPPKAQPQGPMQPGKMTSGLSGVMKKHMGC
jgi:hypothetical protein